jgi:hypothetical protein
LQVVVVEDAQDHQELEQEVEALEEQYQHHKHYPLQVIQL